MLLTKEQIKVCQEAIDVYGADSQIPIVAEEASEFIQVLMKTLRFDNPQDIPEDLREKVKEELADVIFVLTHVYLIFELSEEDVKPIIERKAKRLKTWLETSSSQAISMKEEMREW